MLILKPLTTNEFTLKDSFHFAEEIDDQQSSFFMDSLDENSLFTNILIEICTNKLFKESESVQRLSKSEFKELFVWLLKICLLFSMEYLLNKSMVTNRW